MEGQAELKLVLWGTMAISDQETEGQKLGLGIIRWIGNKDSGRALMLELVEPLLQADFLHLQQGTILDFIQRNRAPPQSH